MLRNLMSFDNVPAPSGASENLYQIFFGGIFTTIGGATFIATQVDTFAPNFPGARTGIGALALAGGGASNCAVQVFDSQPKWTVGFAFWAARAGLQSDLMWMNDGNPPTSSIVGSVVPAVSPIQFGVGVSADNSVYVKFSGGTQSSAPGVFTSFQWTYLEIQGTIGASETIIVKINGNVVLTATGVDTNTTGSGTANCMGLCCTAGGITGIALVYIDDVYVLDGQDASGGDPAKSANNDFLGPIHVAIGFPTAPGFYSQFTPLAGQNWQEVSSYNFSDAAYVSTATDGAIDTYGHPAVPAGTIIFGTQLNIIARKTPAGSRVLAPFYRGGGTDFPQVASQMGLSESYETLQCEFDNDPATGETWTGDGLTAGQFGQKMTA